MNAYPILTTPRGRSAFKLRDPEGAPSTDGNRYHAALDWFAPATTPVHAPRSGRVVEARKGGDSSGQVFGGTCKIQMMDEPDAVFVMRHILPQVGVGDIVDAGKRVGWVHQWNDGPEHIHLEVWKVFSAGYAFENMTDPGLLNWTVNAEGRPFPPPFGDSLRLVIGSAQYNGWHECANRMRWIVQNGLDPKKKYELAWRGKLREGAYAVETEVKYLVRKYL